MDVENFFCPQCKNAFLCPQEAEFFCPGCRSVFPIHQSIPILFPFEQPSVNIKGASITLKDSKNVYDRVYSQDQLMGTDLDKEYDRETKTQLLRACGSLSGKRLLDLGTGAGNLWDYVSGDVAGYAVDISETGALKALDRFPALTAAAAVGESLPFPDSFFDAVIAADTIEHTFSPQATFSEIYRVLKPGAAFAASFPTPGSLLNWGRNQLISRRLTPGFLWRLVTVLFHRRRLFGKFDFQPIDRDIDLSGWKQLMEEHSFFINNICLYPSPPQIPIVYLVEAIKIP